MVAADVFRKLAQLNDASLLSNAPQATRVAWLAFLVAKAHLTAPTASPLAAVSAFHLLLAATVEAGLIPSAPPLDSLCAATGAVPAEIDRFRSALRSALPPTIRNALPFYPGDLSTAVRILDEEYAALLATASHRVVPDERVFVDAPHLLATSASSSPPVTPPPAQRQPSRTDGTTTPVRSPSRKRRAPDQQEFHTPRTRKDVLRRKMTLTPRANRFSHFVGSSSGADALDALAAVASSAPHSPAVSRSTVAGRAGRVVPATPISSGCAAVLWLKRLSNERPETRDEDKFFRSEASEVQTTDAMMGVLKNKNVWVKIAETAFSLSDKLAQRIPDLAGPDRKREALAVFFAALESILVREDARLRARSEKPWVIDNLGKATSIHKSLLLCSWEVTSASYGRKNLAVFNAAIDAFEIPAVDIVKAVEPFVRLPDMPRSLSSHINLCGVRVVESMAWKADSKLVRDLRDRAQEMAAKRNAKTVQGKEDVGKMVASVENDPSLPENPTREFVLEFFYKKMLSVASERAQELLMRLGMDAIAEPVWATIKYAVWEKWHLMVDRHLDQIIMCCVYGVAKVRRYELKFREIIQAYQTMSHVREPSFSHYLPGVFRAVSLNSHLNLMPSDDCNPPRPNRVTESRGDRGDIIKLYNQVFIHAMKALILEFQVQGPVVSPAKMSVKNLVGPGTSSEGSYPQSSSAYVTPASHNGGSGMGSLESRIVRDENKDTLNEKVMSSPMRVLRPHASPRRIGRVTVSPMSPGGRSLVAIRQSPGRRAAGGIIGSMTPGTRKLYAFGESPVRSLDKINRSLAQDDARSNGGTSGRSIGRRPVPLSFEGSGVGQRTASVRKRFADVLTKKSLRHQIGSVRFSPVAEGTPSAASGSDVISRTNALDKRSTGADGGGAKAGA